MMVNLREIDLPPAFPPLWNAAQRQAPDQAAVLMSEFLEKLGEVSRGTKGMRPSANRS